MLFPGAVKHIFGILLPKYLLVIEFDGIYCLILCALRNFSCMYKEIDVLFYFGFCQLFLVRIWKMGYKIPEHVGVGINGVLAISLSLKFLDKLDGRSG